MRTAYQIKEKIGHFSMKGRLLNSSAFKTAPDSEGLCISDCFFSILMMESTEEGENL